MPIFKCFSGSLRAILSSDAFITTPGAIPPAGKLPVIVCRDIGHASSSPLTRRTSDGPFYQNRFRAKAGGKIVSGQIQWRH